MAKARDKNAQTLATVVASRLGEKILEVTHGNAVAASIAVRLLFSPDVWGWGCARLRDRRAVKSISVRFGLWVKAFAFPTATHLRARAMHKCIQPPPSSLVGHK